MLAKLIIILQFCLFLSSVLIRFSMIDQIIDYNILSPLLGDDYKAGGIETII